VKRELVEEESMALGWMWAECCSMLDRGGDPRKEEVPDMLERYRADMEGDEG